MIAHLTPIIDAQSMLSWRRSGVLRHLHVVPVFAVDEQAVVVTELHHNDDAEVRYWLKMICRLGRMKAIRLRNCV
jgi:hypothetical protein